MKAWGPNYYSLAKPKQGAWSQYSTDLRLFFNWVLNFIIRRAFISIAVGPNELTFQKSIHPMFLTDDRSEKGFIVLNVLPEHSQRMKKNYFHKFPEYTSIGKRQESFNSSLQKKHLDFLIAEIGYLLAGNSTQEKCGNKKFAIEDLHIKGIERLDCRLAEYFKEQVCQKYGNDFFLRQRTVNLNFYSLETDDDALLESVEVNGDTEQYKKPFSERKFLIACMARNQNYMYWIKDFVTSAGNIGCTVIGFNYRGLDHSKGMICTKNSLINDALAQAMRLIEFGAKPENIAFEGMSMGGAIATISAARMHANGMKVKLYNERSYRSLVRLVVGFIMPKDDSNPLNPINWLRYLIVGLTYTLVAPVMVALGWYINAASAWNRIPLEYKNYSVARNHQNPGHFDDDEYVHDSYASIASLVEENKVEVKKKQEQGFTLSKEELLLLKDKRESHEFTLERTQVNSKFTAHSAPRRFLYDTYSHTKTMQSYMIESLSKTLETKEPTVDLTLISPA